MTEEFKLDGRDYIELNNLLKITGFCESGGRAKSLIADGLVKVDGQFELRKRYKVKKGQQVELDGQIIHVK